MAGRDRDKDHQAKGRERGSHILESARAHASARIVSWSEIT
jgi:hypothetical protein